jgi:hypothetical protein
MNYQRWLLTGLAALANPVGAVEGYTLRSAADSSKCTAGGRAVPPM